MPITVTCRGCQKRYQVKDEMAGKKFRCPKCAEVVAVGANWHDGVEARDDDEDDEDDYHQPRALPEPRRRREPPPPKKRARARSSRGGEVRWFWILGGIGGVGALLALVLLFVFPPAGLLFAIGFILVGTALNFVGGIGCLVKAFQEDVVCGLLYLFVPFYGLYYLITRWDDVRPFGGCLVGGLGLEGLGVALVIAGIGMTTALRSAPSVSALQANDFPFADRTGGSTIAATPPEKPQFTPPETPRLTPPEVPQVNPPNLPQLPHSAQPPNISPPQSPNLGPGLPPNFPPNAPRLGPNRPQDFPRMPQRPNVDPRRQANGRDGRAQVILSDAEAQQRTTPAPAGHKFSRGDKVYLQWASSWYECEVLDVNVQGNPKVHWIGWSDTWDEVVTPDRVRIPKA